jgi:hypothetical protein
LSSKFNDFIGSMTKKFETMVDDTKAAAENGKAKAESAISDVASSVNSKAADVAASVNSRAREMSR